MKGIILAAGYGTRLKELGINTPKPLLLIAGKPVIEYIIDRIDNLVDEIVVVTNDKFYNEFLEWKNKHSNKKITLINDGSTCNENRLGGVGDMHFAVNKLNIQEDVLIIAGDNLFEFDISKILTWPGSSIGVIDLKDPAKLSKKFGTILLDENNKIINFEEKPKNPKSALAATLIYYLKKDDVDFLKTFNSKEDAGLFIISLCERTEVYGTVFNDTWIDIGSPEQYEEANKLFSQKK